MKNIILTIAFLTIALFSTRAQAQENISEAVVNSVRQSIQNTPNITLPEMEILANEVAFTQAVASGVEANQINNILAVVSSENEIISTQAEKVLNAVAYGLEFNTTLNVVSAVENHEETVQVADLEVELTNSIAKVIYSSL